MEDFPEGTILYDSIGPFVPDEEEALQRIHNELAPIFEIASSLFDYSTNLFDQGPDIPRDLLPDTVRLGLGMYSQVLKCYRSVVANVQLGLSETASAACRILFETSATASFIFRHSIKLRQFENGKLIELEDTYQQLTVDLRAQLYELHERYENRRWVEDVDRLGASEDLVSEVRSLTADPDFVEALEQQVGPKWVSRVKKYRHYSGMGMKSVAVSLDEAYWSYYLLRYRPLSWSVHAGNANWSVNSDVGEDGKTAAISVSWYSNPSDLWLPIMDATALTFFCPKGFCQEVCKFRTESARFIRSLF